MSFESLEPSPFPRSQGTFESVMAMFVSRYLQADSTVHPPKLESLSAVRQVQKYTKEPRKFVLIEEGVSLTGIQVPVEENWLSHIS